MTETPRDPGASPIFSVHVDVVVGLGVGVGVGGGTFFVFKPLDNYMVQWNAVKTPMGLGFFSTYFC